MGEQDVWRTATLMVKHFGDDAIIECAERVDRQRADGDPAGAHVWKRVMASIVFLLDGAPPGTIH
jgi:hypothetical protein